MYINMAFYGELWFWAFIIGLVLFIIGVIFYDYDRNRKESQTPFWVWVLIVLGIVFLIVGLLMYILLEPSNSDTAEISCNDWKYVAQ